MVRKNVQGIVRILFERQIKLGKGENILFLLVIMQNIY